MARTAKPKCECGCKTATKGGRFLPGHDAKLKSKLVGAVRDGDKAAAKRMRDLGWERFLPVTEPKLRARRTRKAAA